MLTPVKERDIKPESIQEDIYLNFNHRPQRIISYNLLVFIWSISNLLFYCDVVSEKGIQETMYSSTTNNLLLVYYLMTSVASFTILFIFYYQLKVKDIASINISFSIASNQIELPLIDGINLFVGLIYFLSFLLHFAATWKMSGDVCGGMEHALGCGVTIISSTLLSIAFPIVWSTDIVDNYLKNPNKRILCISLIIFLSSFTYIFELQSNNFGENTYYLKSYVAFAQTSFWLISAATAIIYICEGFYHEGVLKHYFEIIVSFVLLCSPFVAYSVNIIEFNGNTGSHETWFLIVVLSIFMSYDLQRLDGFKINVIGAQSGTANEKIITAPEPEFDINTPSFMRKPPNREEYKAPNIVGNGSINRGLLSDDDKQNDNDDDKDDNDHVVYGGKSDFNNDDYETEISSSSKSKRSLTDYSYLVFKKFSFKLDDKKQRLLIFNTLLLVYGVAKFIFMFNFWVNYDKTSFKNLQNKEHNLFDFSMHLKESTYQLYCVSFVAMIIISVAVIFMEWFIISAQDQKRYKFYKISCGILYIICGVLQLIAVIFGSSDYCKYLDRAINDNGENYYCHMQYVATALISIMLPLFILSIDILNLSKTFYSNTRIRINIFHLIISLSTLLFYVGFYNYYDNLDTYSTTKLTGFLMISFSFIFSTIMSPLFIYLQSNTFSNLSNFIATILIIVGIGVVLTVNNISVSTSSINGDITIDNINPNISEWILLISMSVLVAYEIQLL